MWARAAQDHFDSASLFFDVKHGGTHAFIRVVRFAWDLLAPGQDRFHITERNSRRAAFASLYDATDHLAKHFLVFVVQRVTFGFADLLNDDLFGGLRANSTDGVLGIDRSSITGGLHRAVNAVDDNRNIGLLAVVFFGRRKHRRFNRLKYNFRIDMLVSVDRVNDPQDLSRIHVCKRRFADELIDAGGNSLRSQSQGILAKTYPVKA